MLRCYDEMVGQEKLFKALRKTVYTTQIGQSGDRDVAVGQDWLSSKFQAVKQLSSTGPFINWHHGRLFHQFGGFRNHPQFTKNTRKAMSRFLASR